MAWYSRNWKYRLPIEVPAESASSTLTDFPVCINIGTASPATRSHFFAHMNAAGSDVVVTIDDGQTETAVEVVSVDAGNEQTQIYFKSPSLNPSFATRFYLYYGNPDATARSAGHAFGRNAVWSNSFVAVYHLEHDPSVAQPLLADATGNGHDLASAGAMDSADVVAGQVGNAISLDGVDDHLAASLSMVSGFPLTLEAWGSRSNTATEHVLVSLDDSGSSSRIAEIVSNSSGQVQLYAQNSGAELTNISGTTNLGSGSFFQCAGVFSSGAFSIFANGNVENSSTATYSLGAPNAIRIGANRYHGLNGNFFEGSIDAVRISNIARSPDWIEATYSNLSAPELFYNVGKVETELVAAYRLPADPIALYLADETSGSTLIDYLGNHDATLINSPATGEAGIVNDGGAAIRFSETTSDSVQLGGLGTFGSAAPANGIAAVFWVRSVEDSTRYLIEMANGSSDILNIRLNEVFDGDVYAELTDSASNTISGRTAGTNWNDGESHMIAVVWLPASQSVEIYVDGEPQTIIGGLAEAGVNTADFSVGRICTPINLSSHLDVTLDAIAFYAKSLASSEIETIYNAGRSLLFSDASADLTTSAGAICSGMLAADAFGHFAATGEMLIDEDLFAEANATIAGAASVATSALMTTGSWVLLNSSTVISVSPRFVCDSSAAAEVETTFSASVFVSFIEAHIDFEPAAWAEFISPPEVSGLGATLEQHDTQPTLLRGQTSARVLIAQSQSGSAVLRLPLSQTFDQLGFRLYLNTEGMTTGEVTFARGRSAEGDESWSLSYDAERAEVALNRSSGVVLQAGIRQSPAWVCVAISLDCSSNEAELLVNGLSIQNTNDWPASAETASIEIGCVTQTAEAAGWIGIDEVMIANRYLSPRLPLYLRDAESLFSTANSWQNESF